MHEFFLFQNILLQIENLLKPYKNPLLKKIIFIIGEYSGIEETYLKEVIETFKENTLLKEAEIIFEKEYLKIQCLRCQKILPPIAKSTQCPNCLSFETKIVSGMDFYIKSLEIEIDQKD